MQTLDALKVRNDASVDAIQVAGSELMSFSGIRYEGRFLDVPSYTNVYTNVHVMEFGAGPPLVLVHGASGGGAIWHRQIAELMQYRRVIVPDIPLFGLSDMPTNIVNVRSQLAEVVLGVMDEFGIARASIAGHSLGGFAVAGALIEAPERFDRAALVSPAGFGQGIEFGVRFAASPLLGYFTRHDIDIVHSVYFDRIEAQTSPPSPERDAVKHYGLNVNRRSGRLQRFRKGIRRFASLRGQTDVIDSASASAISAETLIIWGSEDRVIPASHAHYALDIVPNSTAEFIPNRGHLLQVEAPTRLTQLFNDWFVIS